MRQFQCYGLGRRVISNAQQNFIRTIPQRFCSSKLQQTSHTTLLSCAPGKEYQLLAEVASKVDIEETDTQIVKPGLVQIPAEVDADLIFALQKFPASQTHTNLAMVSLPSSWTDDPLPQTILTHALVPKLLKGTMARSAINNRCENMLKTLTKNFSSQYPQFSFIKPHQLSWRKDSTKLFQLLSLDRSSFIISTSEIENLAIGSWPSPYVAGLCDINLDFPGSPNSAFRKLNEAFWCMGCFPKPGDFVMDFGGSPGGWASLFLHSGAIVNSLDKAAFEFSHPNLVTMKADAFEFEPPFDFGLKGKMEKVDWLSWDVICPPEKTLGMLGKMCNERWARKYVVTLKFTGWSDEYFQLIDECLKIGRNTGHKVRAKSFFNNKNEVSLLMKE